MGYLAVSGGQLKNHDEFDAGFKSVIFVERDSQKGIIIGNKGSALKKIGTKMMFID